MLRTLAADAQGQLDAKLARALLDPLVLAVYTLAGRGDLTDRQLLQALTRSASGAKIAKPAARIALELLLDTGILAADANGRIRQSQPGVDLAVYANGRVGAGAKSEAMKLFYSALDAWGGKALYRVPRQRRRFLSTTFLVEGARLSELNQELEAAWRDTVAKLRQKYESANGDTVMHTGLRAWPLLDATPIDKGARQ